MEHDDKTIDLGRWDAVTNVRKFLPGKRTIMHGSPVIRNDEGVLCDASMRAQLFCDFLVHPSGIKGLWVPGVESQGPMPPELRNLKMYDSEEELT